MRIYKKPFFSLFHFLPSFFCHSVTYCRRMKKHRWISRQPNTAMSDCASLCSCFRHTDVMNELTKEHNTSLPTESKSLKFSAIPLKIFQLDLKPRCAEELLPLKKLDFLSRRSLMIPLLQGILNEETFSLEVCLFYLENVKKWVEENKKSQKRLQRKIAMFLVKFINLSLGLFDKWLPTNFVRFLLDIAQKLLAFCHAGLPARISQMLFFFYFSWEEAVFSRSVGAFSIQSLSLFFS